MRKRMCRAHCLILISLVVVTLMDLTLTSQALPTRIYLDPSNIIDPTITPGTLFNVTVWVENVTNLFAWQVKLFFEPTTINVTRGWVPTWDPEYVLYGKSRLPLVSYSATYVQVADTLFGGDPVFDGSGKLAIIEFEVKSIGYSDLDINSADTYLLNGSLGRISTSKESGVFDNRPPVEPATMYVDPPEIVDPLLVPSTTFEVNVTITNATDVYSFEFKLGYDPTLLTLSNAQLGDFFPFSVVPTVNNETGYVLFSASLVSPEPPRSGNGTLATLTFHVEDLGVSNLDLYDTNLANQSGEPRPHTAEDGFFNNVKVAKLYVEPLEIIDPELVQGVIFEINITIDDVENLYGYEFKLGYNTEMLTGIGILVHPVLSESNFYVNMMVDDILGQVWVNVTYYSPANPVTTYSPESLVTLTFKVDNIGSSVLDLYETTLVNSTGQLISHEITDGFVMTLIRDVAIVNVTFSPSWVYQGWLVNINVTARNKGNVSETFDVNVYYNNTNLIDSQTVTDLAPNEEIVLSFIWNTSDVSEGLYTIKGEATLVPYEFNEADNVLINGPVEIKVLLRDVAIMNVTVDSAEVYQGWPVNITVTAKNEGMVNETFDVKVYYNDTNLIAVQTVIDLAPDKNITLTFIWNTTDVPECYNYTISAEAESVPFEVDLTDNVFTYSYVKIKILGDIDGDGKVDILDLAILSLAFGSYDGHPRWNPDADLNRDGKVDILDLAMGASNFGRTC